MLVHGKFYDRCKFCGHIKLEFKPDDFAVTKDGMVTMICPRCGCISRFVESVLSKYLAEEIKDGHDE